MSQRMGEAVEVGAVSKGLEDVMLGRVALGMAHDINGLLSVILGSLACLEQLTASARDRESVAAARSACDLISGMNRQLLELRRRGARSAAHTGPRATVAGLMPLLHAAVRGRARLRVEPVADRGAMGVNSQDLARVLLNLVINAAEASVDSHSLIEVQVQGTENFLTVTVADRGGGMTAAERKEATRRGVSNKPNGFGLGLAIVREIADRWNGELRLDARPGGGTLVRVNLRGDSTPSK